MICKPKLKGGLGIVNFQKQNAALLLKFLDKFYNKRDIPWVQLVWSAHYQGKVPHEEKLCGSFWWKDVMKQVDNFRGVSVISMGAGDTFMFWQDNWKVDGVARPFMFRFPRLFSYVLNDKMSTLEVYSVEDLSQLFYRPLSTQAFQELQTMQSLMHHNQLSETKDEWHYCWGESYSAK
jgi:hypothetical protein